MRQKSGSVTFLVVGSLAVVALAAMIVDDGWLLGVPVLIGFVVAAKVWSTIAR